MNITQNYDSILKDILSGKTVEFNITTIEQMNLLIASITKQFNKSDANSILKAALIEFILNGFKAELKRDYFKKNNLSITKDYEKGNQNFKNELYEGRIVANSVKELNKSIFLKFCIMKEYLSVEILNPSKMTEQESVNVKNLMMRASEKGGLGSIVDTNEQSEGAGLGILMIFSMLNKLSLPAESIGFHTLDESTLFYIKIPMELFSK